jgi:hypothetical protein
MDGKNSLVKAMMDVEYYPPSELIKKSSPECWCKFTFRYLYPSSNLPVFRIGLRAGQF